MLVELYDFGISLSMLLLISVYSMILFVIATTLIYGAISNGGYKYIPQFIPRMLNNLWYESIEQDYKIAIAYVIAAGLSIVPLSLIWVISIPLLCAIVFQSGREPFINCVIKISGK